MGYRCISNYLELDLIEELERYVHDFEYKFHEGTGTDWNSVTFRQNDAIARNWQKKVENCIDEFSDYRGLSLYATEQPNGDLVVPKPHYKENSISREWTFDADKYNFKQ